jgi:hypothetical protein
MQLSSTYNCSVQWLEIKVACQKLSCNGWYTCSILVPSSNPNRATQSNSKQCTEQTGGTAVSMQMVQLRAWLGTEMADICVKQYTWQSE